MKVIDLVKWDGHPQTLVWKFPSQELSTWTQLIVNESQNAILVKEGAVIATLGPGRHTLDTKNIPGLTTVIGLPFGGKSPYTAEIWFFDLTVNLSLKWGTADPIQVEDPKYKTLLPVRSYGQYGIRVVEPAQFYRMLTGQRLQLSASDLKEQLRGILLTKVKSAIGKSILSSSISVFEASAHLDDLSALVEGSFNEPLQEYGLKSENFSIMSISVPEDDPSVIAIKKALAKKAEMGIVGFTYQQEKSFEVLNSAASNEGSAGGLLNAGLSLGVGVGLAKPFADSAANLGASLSVTDNKGAVRSDSKDKIQLLRELSSLMSEGILSREEFEKEKQKILKD